MSDEFCHGYFIVKFTQENTDRLFIDGIVYHTSYRGQLTYHRSKSL
jgi:hypothetical protein